MTVKELYSMTFNEACERLCSENDLITTYESLKEYAIQSIREERLFVAIHILEAIQQFPADYYNYDYCMGTLDSPTPLFILKELIDYCDDTEEADNAGYKAQAHIHSLDGAMDEITVLESRQEGNQTIYVVDYKGVKCKAIFNPFVCEYYADDKYGVIKEDR